jgi:hypothetical protein
MWVSSIVAKDANKGMTESDVVMVAHNGMRLDHVVLVKTMITCGLSLPLWTLSDTLPIFDLVIIPGSSSKLPDLVRVYAPWFAHIENDTASDAEALKNVVKSGVINWDVVCYTFSTPCIDFTKSVGLNMTLANTATGTTMATTMAATAIAGHNERSIGEQASWGHQRLVRPIVSETEKD